VKAVVRQEMMKDLKDKSLSCHTFCTLGTLALLFLVYNGVGGTAVLVVCGIYSLGLSIWNPVSGIRTAKTVGKRLAFIGLEILNLAVLAGCIIPPLLPTGEIVQ